MGLVTDAAAPPRWSEYVPVDDLVPAESNAKAHDQALLARSVETFGFVEPVVVDERTGRLLSGHGRTEHLTERRAAGDDPPEGVIVGDDGRWLVQVVRGVRSRDDAHATAMGIALNRVGERGGWVPEVLTMQLDELRTTDLLDATGWSADELDDMIAARQEADVSFTPERRGGEAAHAENSLDDWARDYRNKQVRSMVFDFPLDAYRLVTEQAARARKAYGVESNAELFQKMLGEWTAAHPA